MRFCSPPDYYNVEAVASAQPLEACQMSVPDEYVKVPPDSVIVDIRHPDEVLTRLFAGPSGTAREPLDGSCRGLTFVQRG